MTWRIGRLGSLVLLLAAALLAGQAAGLHHAHASTADCPPGTCFHQGAGADRDARWVESDDCLLCDLVHQGRTVTPVPSISTGDVAEPTLRRRACADATPDARPALDGRGPRAPPRAA